MRMAMFDQASRYVRNASIYEASDRRGRRVPALTAADAPAQALLGEHLRREGQRLDHLANFYLQDPNAFWRICEINDALLPDALAEVDAVKIPTVL
jgi:hypothetical protein